MQRFVSALVASAACAAAAAGQPFPTPGLYRVDTEGSTSFGAGGQDVRQVLRTDGKTGNTTMTQQMGGRAVDPRQFEGAGSVTQCIPARKALAAANDMAASASCRTVGTPRIEGDVATVVIECPSLRQEIKTRRLDERTWQREIDTEHLAGGTPLPAATAQAMAPVIAHMEDRLRQNPPEAEAAMLRQQLARLQGKAPAAAPGSGVRHQATLRYTRIAERCS